MNTIETEKWKLGLPKGWRQKETSIDNQICFENHRQTNEIFISTYNSKNGLERVSDLIKSNLEIEKTELKNMLEYKWVLNEKITPKEFTLNSIDENKNYRIYIKHLFDKDFFIRFTFHDYDYNKRNENNKIVTETLDSFQLKEIEN